MPNEKESFAIAKCDQAFHFARWVIYIDLTLQIDFALFMLQ